MIEATVETFEQLSADGPVLVDIWGPQCQPCLALMPAVEALAETYGDRVRFLKVNAPDNRKVCRDLRVAGLPAYLTLRDGVEVERLTSNAHDPWPDRTSDPAPARRRARRRPARPRTPAQHRDRREVNPSMELQGKKVIALGERDSVPGEALAAVARSAGAEVIEIRTECFV